MADFRWPGWKSRHSWPEEPRDYVFLARAFDRIGDAMWPDWTGHEVEDAERPFGRRIPSADDAYINGVPHFGFHREYRAEVIKAAGTGHPNPDDPIPEGLWRAVAVHNHQEFNRIRFAIMRRDSVVAECHRLALSGDLKFAWRRKGGGTRPMPIGAADWEIDYAFIPFATLGYGDDLGLSSPNPTAWLFVTESSLNYVLGLAPRPHSGSENLDHIVPRKPSADKVQAVADQLDNAGVPIREVTLHKIKQLWRASDGNLPKVRNITDLMKGGGKGGRPFDSRRKTVS